MANKPIDMKKFGAALRLYVAGHSNPSIPLTGSLSKNTDKQPLKIYAAPGEPWGQIEYYHHFGLQPMVLANSHILLEVVEDPCNLDSLIMTSQVPADKWDELKPDNTAADAIMDRIVHPTHFIVLKEYSMSKNHRNAGTN